MGNLRRRIPSPDKVWLQKFGYDHYKTAAYYKHLLVALECAKKLKDKK